MLKDPAKIRPLVNTAVDSLKGLGWEAASEGLLQSGPQAAIGRDLDIQTEKDLGIKLGDGTAGQAYLKGAEEGALAAVGMWGVGAPLSAPAEYSDQKLKKQVSTIINDPNAPVPVKLQAIQLVHDRVGKINKAEADQWADQIIKDITGHKVKAAETTAAPPQGAGSETTGTHETGAQGAGQPVPGGPAAGLDPQDDYELQQALQTSAPTVGPGAVAADLPGAEPVTAPMTTPVPAEPVGTLAKAAQAINPYAQLAGQPFANAPTEQPAMPSMPAAARGLTVNTLQAPSEVDLAQEWAQREIANPATTGNERKNLQFMLNDRNPQKLELVRYWRSFTNQAKPVAGRGLFDAKQPLAAPAVARDSAPPPGRCSRCYCCIGGHRAAGP